MWHTITRSHQAMLEAGLLDEFVEYRRCGSLILEGSEAGAVSV